MERTLSALDLGSNTVLLLTVRPESDGSLTCVQECCRTTRLGADPAGTGLLGESAITRTVLAMREFRRAAERTADTGLGVVAATSAVRNAHNRERFLELCAAEFGQPPLLLSGQREAVFAFRGAASDVRAGTPLITVDIGGGSTEFGAGTPGVCRKHSSADVGCVRIAEQFGLAEVAPPAALRAARDTIDSAFRPLVRRLHAALPESPPPRILVSGGTATTYAALKQGLAEYDRTAVHGFSSTQADAARTAIELAWMPSARRAELPGVSASRAPVLAAGMLILERGLTALGAHRFTVTTRALRYGLVVALAADELEPTWRW